MAKTVLTIIGILLIIVGVIALIPSWTWVTQPTWYSIVEIIVGIVAVAVAAGDKK